ncbi:MAG: LptF/LptG family permease, partial [bacterium]
MRIFTRYIAREFLSVFLAAVLILIGIFLINDAMQFIASLVVRGAGLTDVLKIFILGIPASFMFVIPVSFLMGWVVAVGRLAGDSEILALQSSGINPRIILRPVILSGLAVAGFLLYSNSNLSPESNYKMNNMVRRILSKNILRIKDKTFSKIGNYIFYVDSIKKDLMKNVRIYKLNNNFAEVQIYADSGQIRNSRSGIIGLELNDGTMLMSESSTRGSVTSVGFKRYTFTMDAETDYRESMKISHLSSGQLKKRIAELDSRSLPSAMLKIEYNTRNALALSALFLAVLGVTVGIRIKSPKKVVGIGVSIFLIFL